MKMGKRMFAAVLAFGLMLSSPLASMAAEPEAYSYTVSFSAGNHGVFENGTDKLVQKDLLAGTQLFFTAQTAVKVDENSKYYVKGVRLSGRDNSQAEMAALTINVSKDADYVVVYGIKGNQVSYTVKYQDASGRKLAEDDVFYGNVGDKPVVAYRYIAGYRPKALGLTKTLSGNEAENVFTFVYTEAEEGSGGTIYEDGGTTIVYVDRYVPGTGGGAGAGGQAAVEEGAGQGTGEDAQGVEAGEAGEAAGNEETGEESGPEEIVDLDDEETPLGNMDVEDAKEGLPLAGMIALLAGCVAALAGLMILLVRLKKHSKKNDAAR